MSNRTFTMVKPDAFSKGHSGAIIDKILKTGFRIVALKATRLSKEKAGELGLNLVRARTVGTHPRFVRMIRELIEERMDADRAKLALGTFGPSHDVCPVDCCPSGTLGRPPQGVSAAPAQ